MFAIYVIMHDASLMLASGDWTLENSACMWAQTILRPITDHSQHWNKIIFAFSTVCY